MKLSRDRIVSIIFILFGLINLFVFIPREFRATGAGTRFPQLLTLVILILGSVMFIYTGKQIREGRQERVPETDKEGFQHFLLLMFFTFCYIFLMDLVGFYILTIIFLFLAMTVLGVNGIAAKGAISISMIAASYMIFNIWLGAPLPLGRILEAILFRD